jgi:diadenosine tetraphosphate (Ap4A) HIT family hydrolase
VKTNWLENEIGTVLWDAFPVSNGHSLVIPKQHFSSIYELPPGKYWPVD